MSIFEIISADIISAMKSKEKEKLEALRGIKKVLLEAKTAKSTTDELSDEEALKIIQKLTKQGKDSAEIYKTQNRPDLYDQEMAQVKVFETYLPKMLSEAEIEAAVKVIIEREGAVGMKDMGKVMGFATKELAGKADGKTVSEKVKALLQ